MARTISLASYESARPRIPVNDSPRSSMLARKIASLIGLIRRVRRPSSRRRRVLGPRDVGVEALTDAWAERLGCHDANEA